MSEKNIQSHFFFAAPVAWNSNINAHCHIQTKYLQNHMLPKLDLISNSRMFTIDDSKVQFLKV